MTWHRVADELPPPLTDVLVAGDPHGDGVIIAVAYQQPSGAWMSCEDPFESPVAPPTHWMPLPAPPVD